MKISQLIKRLQAILEAEGDIQVELPDGTLMRTVDVYTLAGTANEAPKSLKLPPEAK